jgi:hypothetical protein
MNRGLELPISLFGFSFASQVSVEPPTNMMPPKKDVAPDDKKDFRLFVPDEESDHETQGQLNTARTKIRFDWIFIFTPQMAM